MGRQQVGEAPASIRSAVTMAAAEDGGGGNTSSMPNTDARMAGFTCSQCSIAPIIQLCTPTSYSSLFGV